MMVGASFHGVILLFSFVILNVSAQEWNTTLRFVEITPAACTNAGNENIENSCGYQCLTDGLLVAAKGGSATVSVIYPTGTEGTYYNYEDGTLCDCSALTLTVDTQKPSLFGSYAGRADGITLTPDGQGYASALAWILGNQDLQCQIRYIVTSTAPASPYQLGRWNFSLAFIERSTLMDPEDPFLDLSQCLNSYDDVGPSRCTFECLAAGVSVQVVGGTATVSTPTAPLQFLGGEVTCQCQPFTLTADPGKLFMAGDHPGARAFSIIPFGLGEAIVSVWHVAGFDFPCDLNFRVTEGVMFPDIELLPAWRAAIYFDSADVLGPARCIDPTTDCEQMCYKTANWTVVVREGEGKIYPEPWEIFIEDEGYYNEDYQNNLWMCRCPVLSGTVSGSSILGVSGLVFAFDSVGDGIALLTVENEFFAGSDVYETETCRFLYKASASALFPDTTSPTPSPSPSPVPGGPPSCGCPGWDLHPDSLLNGATVQLVSDCPLCAMHSAVFLKDGAFVSLGALEFDDSALTYTFWLYASRQNNLAPIFDFGAAPVPGATVQPGDNNHRLQIDGEGRLQFSVWRAQSSVELVDFELFPLNAWVHVAVTLDGSQAGLFRDGRRVASAEVPPNGLETRGSCLIGAANWELDSSWEGAFSDFRMYKRALHAWEVSALKLGNFSDDDSLLSGDGVPACVQYARSCPLLFQFVFQQVLPEAPAECRAPPNDCAYACMLQNLTLVERLNNDHPVLHPASGNVFSTDRDALQTQCGYCPDVIGQSGSTQFVGTIGESYPILGILRETDSGFVARIEVTGIAANGAPCPLQYQVVGDIARDTHTEPWCLEQHYLASIPACQLNMQWNHAMTDLFRRRQAWAGGLGKLMTSDGDFQTWLCVFGHACLRELRDPVGASASAPASAWTPDPRRADWGSARQLVSEDACRPDLDWMCYVYSEHRQAFCPWAPDSELRLLNERQRTAPWNEGTFPAPAPGCLNPPLSSAPSTSAISLSMPSGSAGSGSASGSGSAMPPPAP
mmetsp:Transcript_4410/g.10666  ORF Transcript_4410/g.10666 Transcript_4410/m.10666 type:complete len:1016 (-) Transcript_4410:122-3169(-)